MNRSIIWMSMGLLLSAPAMTQNIPDTGVKPALFAEGIVSTPYREWTTTFTPDSNTVYFSQGLGHYIILYAEKRNGQWQNPGIAAFSGLWNDTDPFITPDGRRLYFCSDRPADQQPSSPADKNYHIWLVEKTGTSWSVPVCLGAPVNLPGVNSWYPSESQDGDFYFHSWKRPGGHAGNDIYFSKHTGNVFTTPLLLSMDTAGCNTQECRISKKGDFMVFASNRPGSIGTTDLYICFHKDSCWAHPINLGPGINHPGLANMAPGLSPEGTTLYFANNWVPETTARRKLNVYKELVAEMNSVYNGLWNIFYLPLDLEGLRAKAVWQ